jgi:hypothetical protein
MGMVSAGSQKKKHTVTYPTSTESKVLEKLLKAINDLKSDIAFTKKHFMGLDQMKDTEDPAPKRFVNGVLRTILATVKEDLRV